MNDNNKKLLNELQKRQYYRFIRGALGLKCYFDHQEYEIQVKEKSGFQRSDKRQYIAHRLNGNYTDVIYYTIHIDYDNKTFRDTKTNIYSADKFFDSLGDRWIRYLLYGASDMKSYDYKDEGYIDDKMHVKRNLVSRLKSDDFDFIIGAGVNCDFGIGNWSSLLSDIRKKIRSIKSIPGPVDDKKDPLIQLEASMLNTNYMAPQILKDLDQIQYEETIWKVLYNGFLEKITAKSSNEKIQDTNLFQIARIACERSGGCKILTFNYDNVLELIFKNSFNETVTIDYYQSKRKEEDKIRVIHPHGFFPFENKGKINKAQAIVLSSYEYMKGYFDGASYARKRLAEQLKNTNIIIGNSLSDYEEQKVFYINHKRYLSKFSYLFLLAAPDSWMDDYKTIYYLKMGVIPIFFSSFREMNEFLKGMGGKNTSSDMAEAILNENNKENGED